MRITVELRNESMPRHPVVITIVEDLDSPSAEWVEKRTDDLVSAARKALYPKGPAA